MAQMRDSAQHELGWYVRNCALSPVAAQIEPIFFDQLKYLGSIPERFHKDYSTNVKFRRRQLREVHLLLKKYALAPASGESLEQNALFAQEEFGLDNIDTEILLLLLRYERNSGLEEFTDRVSRCLNSASRCIAALVGVETREAHKRLMTGGPLIDSGILSVDDGPSHSVAGPCGIYSISPPLRKHMFRPYNSREEWANAILGPPLATDLTWVDFEHLGSIRDLAARFLNGSKKDRSRGINVLLHGPVGTGKTEFCKVLAAKSGMEIWSICEADGSGGEPTRNERLASFCLAQRLLKKRENALLLFDEAEDLVGQHQVSSGEYLRTIKNGSKIYINRLIEKNPVPVLWTCNAVDEIDPAVLRRMSLAIEVKTPNHSAREKIWRRVLRGTNLQLDENAVHGLSGRYLAPPGVAKNAARAAALAGGGEAEIAQAMTGVLQILGISPNAFNEDRDFEPNLTNSSVNLTALVESLARPSAPRNWSMCLHGAPGTGKSQFARHLAARLGLEVLQLRASDLLSKWVGGSEKQIAAAFATANAQGSMLVIDEADSLLSDRRGASHSWEVTQVNEMLTWMESHPLPFVCTTNLMDRLDQASLRRFTLKLRFDPLSAAQAHLAFEHFFGISALQTLPDGLSPGDFATVRRKRDVFGAADPAVLALWLEEELEAKGPPNERIGFIFRRA